MALPPSTFPVPGREGPNCSGVRRAAKDLAPDVAPSALTSGAIPVRPLHISPVARRALRASSNEQAMQRDRSRVAVLPARPLGAAAVPPPHTAHEPPDSSPPCRARCQLLAYRDELARSAIDRPMPGRDSAHTPPRCQTFLQGRLH